MYYFMMMMLIVSSLMVIVLLRHARPARGIPLKELHPREMAIVSTGLLMLIYVVTYGKISDWMASPKICVYIVVAPLLIALFLWEQFHSPRPYVSLKPLLQWKAILGYFYMIVVMFFSTSTALLSNYMTTILKVDNMHNYTLYVYLIPGYILGAFVCFWWFRWQRWRFRFLIAGGMACFVVFFGMLYFTISPDSTYESLFLPLFFRGLGMMVLLIAFGLFVVEDLNPKLLIYNAFFLITFRAVLAPVMASAFYSNMLYRLQQKYMVQLSENMTMVDTLAASRYTSALGNNLAQGHGIDEAMQLATNSLYSVLQEQSMLLALKHMLGWMFVVTLVIAVISRFVPFHKTVRVPVVRMGEDMV